MPQPKTPPPRRFPVLSFVSPKVQDIIFWESRNGSLPKYKNPPEWGTAHPEDRKYPDHVLVFIAPDEEKEDKWQKWYYAAKRDAQDDYNFELDGDDKIIRTYIVPRAEYLTGSPDYVPPSEGDPDPNATRFSGYEFAEEKVRRTNDKLLDSYFVVVQRFYVNINKVIAEGEAGTPRGEEGSVTNLGASKTSTAILPGIILSRNSRLTEYDLWHNTENRLSLRTGINRSATNKRVGYTDTATTELSHAEPVTAGEPDFSKRLVTTDVLGADAIWEANRRTRANDPAQGSEMTNFLGGGVADIAISLVADTTSADSSFTVIESKVNPLGDGDALKITKTLDSYPTLIDYPYDSSLDALLQITKDVVVPGATGSIAVGDVTEIKAHDKWRSIRIRTEGLGVPKTENLPGVFTYRFPGVLRSASWIGAYAYAYDSSKPVLDWDYDISLIYDYIEPWSAAVDGRLIRVVTASPASIVGSYPPTVFKPESHTVGYVTAAWYSSIATIWAKTSSRTWQTPLALCGGITLTPPFPGSGPGLSVNAVQGGSIPATSPTTIPLGWMTVGVTTRRLKLGYYEVLVRQINSPGI